MTSNSAIHQIIDSPSSDLQEYQRFTAYLLAYAEESRKSGTSMDEATAAFSVDRYVG